MIFKDKLTEWYGEDVKSVLIGESEQEDVAVFLVEEEDEFEVARIFKFGDTTSISIDKKYPKKDEMTLVAAVVSYLGEMGYLRVD